MNGIPLLDSIPVNWFILGTSVLAGVILFLILTQIPDEDEEEKSEEQKAPEAPMMMEKESEVVEAKPKSKPRSKKRAKK